METNSQTPSTSSQASTDTAAHNIFQVLRDDHEKLKGLLERLVQSSTSDSEEWKVLVDQIRDELVAHSRAEEAIFYNSIREADLPDSGIGHSYVEHAMAEVDLRTLQAMKAIDVNWTRIAQKLQKDVLHHIEEEENRVFSLARTALTPHEAEMMGEAFQALKPKMREESFMGSSMEFVKNLMPPRFIARIKKDVHL